MATRGSKKALSKKHEEYIAKIYGGTRSRSSGAAVTGKGDVRTITHLFECKMTKIPSKLLKDFEKILGEARAEGKDPVLAYREYAPDSPLADSEGYVDLTMRLTSDDVEIVEKAWKYEDLCR